MTNKMKKFCLEYAASANATQAAKKAGYSEKTAGSQGERLLRQKEVKKYLQTIEEEMKTEKIATANEMQEMLTSIIRGETEEDVIVVEMSGDGISQAVTKSKKPSMKEKIKAIEVLAKMQGVFDNKANVKIVIPVFGGEDEIEE